MTLELFFLRVREDKSNILYACNIMKIYLTLLKLLYNSQDASSSPISGCFFFIEYDSFLGAVVKPTDFKFQTDSLSLLCIRSDA